MGVEPGANAFSVMMAVKPKQGQTEDEEPTKGQQDSKGREKTAKRSLSEGSEAKVEVEPSKLENLSFSRILTSKSKSADMTASTDDAMTKQELIESVVAETQMLKPKSKRGRKPKKQQPELEETENQKPVKNHFSGLIPPSQDQTEEVETPAIKKGRSKMSKETKVQVESEPKVDDEKNVFSKLMGAKSKTAEKQKVESENLSNKNDPEIEVVQVVDVKEVKGSNAFSKLMGPKSRVKKEEPTDLPELVASSDKKENPKKRPKQMDRLIAETEEAESSSNEFEKSPEVSRRSSVRIQKNMAEIVKKRESQMMMDLDDDDDEEEEERSNNKRKRGPKSGKKHRPESEEMIVDLQDSDDDVYIEKVVITPQKKSKTKLASIFVMGKKANAIKVIEDPARVAARQAFLHSSVPQTLRDQISTNKVRSLFQSIQLRKIANSLMSLFEKYLSI